MIKTIVIQRGVKGISFLLREWKWMNFLVMNASL